MSFTARGRVWSEWWALALTRCFFNCFIRKAVGCALIYQWLVTLFLQRVSIYNDGRLALTRALHVSPHFGAFDRSNVVNERSEFSERVAR